MGYIIKNATHLRCRPIGPLDTHLLSKIHLANALLRLVVEETRAYVSLCFIVSHFDSGWLVGAAEFHDCTHFNTSAIPILNLDKQLLRKPPQNLIDIFQSCHRLISPSVCQLRYEHGIFIMKYLDLS